MKSAKKIIFSFFYFALIPVPLKAMQKIEAPKATSRQSESTLPYTPVIDQLNEKFAFNLFNPQRGLQLGTIIYSKPQKTIPSLKNTPEQTPFNPQTALIPFRSKLPEKETFLINKPKLKKSAGKNLGKLQKNPSLEIAKTILSSTVKGLKNAHLATGSIAVPIAGAIKNPSLFAKSFINDIKHPKKAIKNFVRFASNDSMLTSIKDPNFIKSNPITQITAPLVNIVLKPLIQSGRILKSLWLSSPEKAATNYATEFAKNHNIDTKSTLYNDMRSAALQIAKDTSLAIRLFRHKALQSAMVETMSNLAKKYTVQEIKTDNKETTITLKNGLQQKIAEIKTMSERGAENLTFTTFDPKSNYPLSRETHRAEDGKPDPEVIIEFLNENGSPVMMVAKNIWYSKEISSSTPEKKPTYLIDNQIPDYYSILGITPKTSFTDVQKIINFYKNLEDNNPLIILKNELKRESPYLYDSLENLSEISNLNGHTEYNHYLQSSEKALFFSKEQRAVELFKKIRETVLGEEIKNTQTLYIRGTLTTEQREAFKTLGLNTDASLEDIKKAYKALALVHHPDKTPPQEPEETEEKFTLRKQTAEDNFKKIKKAYDTFME